MCNLEPVKLVLDALAASDLHPITLSLSEHGGAFGFSQVAFARATSILHNAHQVFGNLRALHLSCQEFDQDQYETSQSEAKAFVASFAGSPNLQALVVSVAPRQPYFTGECAGGEGYPEVAREVLRAIFPVMRTIALSGFVLDLQELKGFKARCSLLEQAHLDVVLLVNAGQAAASVNSGNDGAIKAWLKQDLALSNVGVSKIRLPA